ncbi:MarR family transcriptional regulator [Sphingomonas canadensis]|uniref:MarR family transcriptional regulator n=1 Tax=Sphingomonas canadensis TaxID=1219257 RepID=A0ABW3HBJ4_9SPHN|nr:MarR family transcriptional regulator [Sphingomonas canadensis]MCW3837853.1 MarR family transcriptional regulator [Sphingomonas canadensis]
MIDQFSRFAGSYRDLARVSDAVLGVIQQGRADLSLRQIAILLTLVLDPGPHTVRGLAARLCVCKPVITRALNRLGELGFAAREMDPRDKRNRMVSIQPAGADWLAALFDLQAEGAAG